jgi:hypothetical protein
MLAACTLPVTGHAELIATGCGYAERAERTVSEHDESGVYRAQ